MEEIRLRDLNFRLSITHDSIQQAIHEMGMKMNHDLNNEKPLFIGILNGVFMFASDLMKEINIESEISFVKLASYQGIQSSGKVTTMIGMDRDLTGRTIVILDDIIDTGKTLAELLITLKSKKPKKILIATLLFKPDAFKHDFKIDYIGMKVRNDFLVGFGLDYDGLGRNLKDIYVKN